MFWLTRCRRGRVAGRRRGCERTRRWFNRCSRVDTGRLSGTSRCRRRRRSVGFNGRRRRGASRARRGTAAERQRQNGKRATKRHESRAYHGSQSNVEGTIAHSGICAPSPRHFSRGTSASLRISAVGVVTNSADERPDAFMARSTRNVPTLRPIQRRPSGCRKSHASRGALSG